MHSNTLDLPPLRPGTSVTYPVSGLLQGHQTSTVVQPPASGRLCLGRERAPARWVGGVSSIQGEPRALTDGTAPAQPQGGHCTPRTSLCAPDWALEELNSARVTEA